MRRSGLSVPRRLFAVALLGLFGLTLPHPGRTAPAPHAVLPQNPDSLSLPLPAIPPTLRQPAERAAFLIARFWDAMDFSDPAQARNADFLERNLVDFLSVFPHADPAAHEAAAATLLQRAEADPECYRLLAGLLEKYLFSPDSPVFSEELYLLFLDRMTESEILPASLRRRLRFQQEALRKNRPGMPAADFAYETRDGDRTSLYGTAAGETLLLILYDADCAHCREVMDELREEPLLAQAVGAGALHVLAVCLDADRDALLRSSAGLPAAWTTGFETGAIYEDALYMIRSLPTLLLLDADRRVVLRNAGLADLRTYFSELFR